MLIRLISKEIVRDSLRSLRERRVAMGLLTRDCNTGYCPICDAPTIFVTRDRWLRDYYQCIRCASIPRWRALIQVLQTHFPDWRKHRIHESSPGGGSSEKLRRECSNYVATHFFPEIPAGQIKHGYRSENLECQTFETGEFDLVITQDVFEHVLNPALAFKEIARTLKQDGAHMFTVPWYCQKKTLTRAVEDEGKIRYLVEPDYHGNPIDANGSLVVTEWGWDLCDFIYRESGLTTVVIRMRDRYLGIDGEFIEVFISRKSPL